MIINLQQPLMSEQFLPDIDIRIGKFQPSNQPHSIHSLKKLTSSKKNKMSKYQKIKQSVLTPLNSPLHQLVRMSMSNKTVVFKKRLMTEERVQRENLAPLHCHKTNQVVIMKSLTNLADEPSRSELKGCKSLLNTKIRQRKMRSYDASRKLSFNQKQLKCMQTNVVESHLQSKNSRQEQHNNQQFDLCPWDNEKSAFVAPKQVKKLDSLAHAIKRYF